MSGITIHENIPITNTDTTDITSTLERTTEIDLSAFVDDVPSGTTTELSVAGDRSGYELEFARRDDCWTIEGAGDSAKLTAVYSVGEIEREKPDRVPGWIQTMCGVGHSRGVHSTITCVRSVAFRQRGLLTQASRRRRTRKHRQDQCKIQRLDPDSRRIVRLVLRPTHVKRHDMHG